MALTSLILWGTLGIIVLIFMILVNVYALYLSMKNKHYVWIVILLANLGVGIFTQTYFGIMVPVGYYFIQKFQKSKGV